jgi:hypothetical protein
MAGADGVTDGLWDLVGVHRGEVGGVETGRRLIAQEWSPRKARSWVASMGPQPADRMTPWPVARV